LPSDVRAVDTALDAVVFDFDGVILESVAVKDAAFRALFADHPTHVDAIMDLHRRHGGVSRYVKFDMIYADILQARLDPAHKAELGRRFEELVLDRVLAAPMVAGARDVLDGLRGRVPMAVVSGTPDAELAAVIERRGFAHYFAEVHGGSRAKREVIERMVRERNWRTDRMVMVGDATTDCAAARANRIPFIGRIAAGADDPFPAGTITIEDLRGFADGVARALVLPAKAD
jgi:phosphoglycolate phosphatase-like HAD superfamily hydrolase